MVLAKGTSNHRQTDQPHAVLPPKFRTRRRRGTTTPLRRCLTTFCPLPTEKVETFHLGFPPAFLRRIKYFSSFSLHPNQQQQQQPSRRRKPKSIDAMVLLPSIAGKNYSVRHHCTGTWNATKPTLSVALYQPAVTTGLMHQVTGRENHP